MILLLLIVVARDNTRVDRGDPAIAVLSIGYRPLGLRPRAAGWSAATSCFVQVFGRRPAAHAETLGAAGVQKASRHEVAEGRAPAEQRVL